ncbi:MAG: YfcC family protein [Bacillota bacterium]|nr:YfcC family protein [Bacillota bacterium]
MKVNENKSDSQKKKRALPHIFTILLCMIVIATICTWIFPAGSYDRVLNEATKRQVIDPNSFKYVESKPVGFFEMFVSIEEGLIQAANISFLIFCAFSCLYAIQESGAIDAFIAGLIRRTKKSPASANIIIVIIMIIFSVWGSTGTFSYEEVIAFIPIFVTVAYALGYDAMTGVAISVVPVGIGFASATVNPFTIGVAQGIAELPLFSGFWYRALILGVMTGILIAYVMWYAHRVKKDPTKSLTYGMDMSDFMTDETRLSTKMTGSRLATLLALLVAVGVMAWGLLTQKWYINQCAAIFMILSIAVAIINRWSPNKLCDILVKGLGSAVLPAFVVGLSRAVLVVLTKGMLIDSIIHGCVSIIQGLSLYASGFAMLVFQTVLNFLIPSGSGQAAVSMPIMTPIADIIGMNRQIAVLIFQFGDGFSNLLWPTSFMVVACSMAKIPLSKYYKWLLPFFAICFVVQCLFIFGAIAMNYM